MLTRKEAQEKIEAKLLTQAADRKAAQDADLIVSEQKATALFNYIELRIRDGDPWDRGLLVPRSTWWVVHIDDHWVTVLNLLSERLHKLGYVTKIIWNPDLSHYGKIWIRDPICTQVFPE